MRKLAKVAVSALLAAGVLLGWLGMPKPHPPSLSAGEAAKADLAKKNRKGPFTIPSGCDYFPSTVPKKTETY